MLFYLPENLNLSDFGQEGNVVSVKLASGGFLSAEPVDFNHIRVKAVYSTDPMDYLNNRYQPGQILKMDLPEKE
jgi:hypothetical protein